MAPVGEHSIRILVVDDEENEAFIDKPVTIKGLLEAMSMIVFGHTHGPEGDRPTDS